MAKFDATVHFVEGVLEKRRRGPEIQMLGRLGVHEIRKGIWSIPLMEPSTPVNFHGRVVSAEFGRKGVNLKGVGNRNYPGHSPYPPKTTIHAIQTENGHALVELPFAPRSNGLNDLLGGLGKEAAESEWNNYTLLRKAELKFIKEEPKLAEILGVTRRSLFVKPVAVFRPTHLIGTNLSTNEVVRVPIKSIPEIDKLNLRVLVRAHHARNVRMAEICGKNFPKTSKQTYLLDLAKYYGIAIKGNELNEKEKQTLLFKMQSRALAYLYVTHVYAKRGLQTNHNTSLATKDFNGTQFADFTTLGESTFQIANSDRHSLTALNDEIRTYFLELADTNRNHITAHPEYEKIISKVEGRRR